MLLEMHVRRHSKRAFLRMNEFGIKSERFLGEGVMAYKE
jgi:hypothetical protein